MSRKRERVKSNQHRETANGERRMGRPAAVSFRMQMHVPGPVCPVSSVAVPLRLLNGHTCSISQCNHKFWLNYRIKMFVPNLRNVRVSELGYRFSSPRFLPVQDGVSLKPFCTETPPPSPQKSQPQAVLILTFECVLVSISNKEFFFEICMFFLIIYR